MGTAARMAAAERRVSCADASRCAPDIEAHVQCRCILAGWLCWLKGVADKRLAAGLGRITLLALIFLEQYCSPLKSSAYLEAYAEIARS